VFKWNDNGRQFNLIQFSKEYSNKKMRENKRKDQARTQDVTEFSLPCLRLWDPQSVTIEVESKTKK
jgi:hypothetical protein